jgi:hypothetical protein
MIRLFPHSLPTSVIVVARAGVGEREGEGRGRGYERNGILISGPTHYTEVLISGPSFQVPLTTQMS